MFNNNTKEYLYNVYLKKKALKYSS